MIKKITCIEIPISNMEKSVSFYEDVIGLKKAYEHPVWTSFDIEGTSFALAASGTKGVDTDTEICRSCPLCVLRYTSGKVQEEPSSTSNFVIYLSVEDLDASFQELINKGVDFISEPRVQSWGGKTAVMLDPDQNILVLSEEE